MTLYAPLFSHESGPAPENVFAERDAAVNWGRKVLRAQPGIEVELMTHTAPEGWRSEAGGETVAEVRARRWQDPVIHPRRAGKATARAAFLKHVQGRIRP